MIRQLGFRRDEVFDPLGGIEGHLSANIFALHLERGHTWFWAWPRDVTLVKNHGKILPQSISRSKSRLQKSKRALQVAENPKSMNRRDSISKQHQLRPTIFKNGLKRWETQNELQLTWMHVSGNIWPAPRFDFNSSEPLTPEHVCTQPLLSAATGAWVQS